MCHPTRKRKLTRSAHWSVSGGVPRLGFPGLCLHDAGRVVTGGRNWEDFAADPYLDGILGAQTVIGLQESVISFVEHFVV